MLYNFQFAAVQVWFDPQNYTVTEGDEVAITLVTSTRHSETDFTVILQYIDGSATGESCLIHDLYIHTYSLSLCLSSSLFVTTIIHSMSDCMVFVTFSMPSI